MGHHSDDNEVEAEDEPRWHLRTFFRGLVLGGLIGVGTGLLLAPAAGRDTVQQLRDGAASARHQAQQAADEARTKAEDLQHTGRELLEENKRRLVRTAEAVKHSAQEAWSNPDDPTAGQPAAVGSQTDELITRS